MNDIDSANATVKKLRDALNNASTAREAESLKKSLQTAQVKARRLRAEIINKQPDKQNIDFHWRGVKRSTLTDEQKSTIVAEFGREAYLSLPA